MSSYQQIEANRRNALKKNWTQSFSRYEASLWRQAGRLLYALEKLNYEAFW